MSPASRLRTDWRIGPAEPTARAIPPPEERPTALVPAERYWSPEFARRELEAVFMHSWHLVGRDQDFPDVGDYLEFQLVDQSVLVVRVEDDLVKAYSNACLHRGMQLRKGCGTMTEIRCGYHSWCWNLDGSVKEVLDPYEFHPTLISPFACTAMSPRDHIAAYLSELPPALLKQLLQDNAEHVYGMEG